MGESNYPRIVFSERLSTGIVVHFENGGCAFFPTAFLYEQRNSPPNTVISEEEDGDRPQHDEAARYWKFVIKIIGRKNS
jgi:hypothetical protein